MSSVVKKLVKNGLMSPPHDFCSNTVYEVIMGSMAYGVNNNVSDMDVYAVCVPHKAMVFPEKFTGHIRGFGPDPENFEVYQKHHMELNEREYDVAIYSLVKYFHLCADNNPNMIDSLFVPDRCVIYASDAGAHMRSHRRLFLSKRIFDKLRGYAFGELKRLGEKPKESAKRRATIEEFGYDVKSAYHVFRLMLEAEMVLNEGDLNLERNREQLKAVRRGEYTLDEVHEWFKNKENALTTLHVESNLQLTVDYKRLYALLYECLEMHYGTLETAHSVDPMAMDKLDRIKRILDE